LLDPANFRIVGCPEVGTTFISNSVRELCARFRGC
jgi:hypothetical protein